MSQFRHVPCCFILCKILAKILTARMQKVISKVISVSQSGFISMRKILAIVLLASKFIKGYERKRIYPRCMIKLTLGKHMIQLAYDSVKWDFLQGMMQELGFLRVHSKGHELCDYNII